MNNNLASSIEKLGITNATAVSVGSQSIAGEGEKVFVRSPIDGSVIAQMAMATEAQTQDAVAASTKAFRDWRNLPAPRRGEIVRQFGEVLREHKSDLAQIVTWEAGKIVQESLGEVQEMIDICDFAVGLSRQLYGLSIASERPQHRLTEQWHPLGPIGVISAFNFPVAVWAWNAAIALVCGDPVVWKPSEKTPLCALACHQLLMKVVSQHTDVPDAVSSVLIGDAAVGQAIAADERLPLVSATGSIPMGRAVAQTVAKRLGKSLLELGGNNAMIVTPSADMELAVRAIVFSAVGTCGQRCTTLRRLIVHQSVADGLVDRLAHAYRGLPIGNPLDEKTLVGPLIDENSYAAMTSAIQAAQQQGGRLVVGGEPVRENVPDKGTYVRPAIVEISADAAVTQQETFAPLLYVIRYDHFDDALEIQNGVPQGLSSAVFTSQVQEAELFCSARGSDCGIANVNIGTSGAEIGGAFGGEKETGGGRESGSDAWKAYMRRATNTINYSAELPLAQGIRFDI